MTAAEARDYVAAKISRQLTRWEIRLDHAIHAVAIVAALSGAVVLLLIAAKGGSAATIAVAAIYSFGLIAMLGCSAAFNVGRSSRFCGALRGIDQSAIFIMIAGSYTPFTVLYLDEGWQWSLTALVWSLAGLGIFLRLFRPRLFAKLSIPLYLSLGWVGLVAFVPLIQAMDGVTFGLLLAGGLLYTAGVAFHLWERLPFRNVIWHGFVVVAAAVHFAAIAVSIAVASS